MVWPPACRPGAVAERFMYGPFEYVKLATYSVAPFVVILSLNVAIVVRLRRTTPMLRHARHGAPPAADSVHLSRFGDHDSDNRRQPRHVATTTQQPRICVQKAPCTHRVTVT